MLAGSPRKFTGAPGGGTQEAPMLPRTVPGSSQEAPKRLPESRVGPVGSGGWSGWAGVRAGGVWAIQGLGTIGTLAKRMFPKI
jgi:hypothetical protein